MPAPEATTVIPENSQVVDVRTPSEFATGHIAGALNIPLDQLESRIGDLQPGRSVLLVCKAGTRARIAAELLSPCRDDLALLEGGMDAWQKAGNPTVISARTRWSLERQVRLIAGMLVVLGVLLATTIAPHAIWLAGFIGLGLSFAGLTDFCPMGVFLGQLPWNRKSRLEAKRNGDSSLCELRH